MGLFGNLRGLAKLVGIGEVAKLVGEAAVETMTGKPIVNERKELTPHDQAYAEKQYQLALATKERKNFMALLLEAAQLGHMEAQYQLGVQHQFHANENSHPLISANWYRRAAEQGYAMAQYALAEMYHNGEGVSHDNKQAVKWYLQAAQKGNVDAQYSLSHMYYMGFGVAQDRNQAAAWYNKAEAQDIIDTQHAKSTQDKPALTVNQDGAEELLRLAKACGAKEASRAVSLYRKAAEQGHSEAQAILGFRYQMGIGVAQDYSQCIAWYRLASEQGNAKGQSGLARMYAMGKGVEKNETLAYVLYSVASANVMGWHVDPEHHERQLIMARRERDNLAKKLTPIALAEAQTLIDQHIKNLPSNPIS